MITKQYAFIIIRGFALTLCIWLALASGLSAQVLKPREQLAKTVEEVIDILHEEQYKALTVDEKNDRLLALVESRFSLDIIVQRALGRHWKKLDAEQKLEFKRLFSKLVIHTYSLRLEGAGERPKFEFGKVVELPKERLEIQSEVEYLNDKISVYYRLAKRNGQWEVYDIVVEGVSLLNNYRKQFNSIMARGSVDKLFATLRKKVESL